MLPRSHACRIPSSLFPPPRVLISLSPFPKSWSRPASTVAVADWLRPSLLRKEDFSVLEAADIAVEARDCGLLSPLFPELSLIDHDDSGEEDDLLRVSFAPVGSPAVYTFTILYSSFSSGNLPVGGRNDVSPKELDILSRPGTMLNDELVKAGFAWIQDAWNLENRSDDENLSREGAFASSFWLESVLRAHGARGDSHFVAMFSTTSAITAAPAINTRFDQLVNSGAD
ncbi:hypothetical protein MKZ38_003921 [Zalerion maritima]|uniref:Uncharacterized protein n=1 Tax=Zalerion maritima TaxID=339359 RepID=A0AAD5RM85_9PEZI|nr:hypothetical protein MKZ38_003921 [Zalerion maritima]